MLRIENETTVPATATLVWVALLDPANWAAWSQPRAARFTVDGIESVAGPTHGVGALRRASATIAVPLFGSHPLHWVDQVTDLAAPHSIEFERLASARAAQWRVRLWLVPQQDGATRVRCRLSVRAVTLRQRLALRLFLSRALERHVTTMLEALAASFADAPERVMEPSVAEPSEVLVPVAA